MSATIGVVVQRHLQEAESARQTTAGGGGGNWWRRHEAVMLSLGSVKKLILAPHGGGDSSSSSSGGGGSSGGGVVQLDINSFLESVVLQDLNQHGKYTTCTHVTSRSTVSTQRVLTSAAAALM